MVRPKNEDLIKENKKLLHRCELLQLQLDNILRDGDVTNDTFKELAKFIVFQNKMNRCLWKRIVITEEKLNIENEDSYQIYKYRYINPVVTNTTKDINNNENNKENENNNVQQI